MKGVWLTALQTEARLIHRTGAVYTIAVQKILCISLVCVGLAFHGGSEKCMLAGSRRKQETFANKIRCDVKPDYFCHWVEFSVRVL